MDKITKKFLRPLISALTVISLISCGNLKPSSDSKIDEESSIIPTSYSYSSDDIPSSNIETYYHVTFVNYDDSLLYEVDVKEGETATYVGETPTKPEDDEFTYEFSGWDKDLDNILSDLTTKAMYDAISKEGWSSIIWF